MAKVRIKSEITMHLSQKKLNTWMFEEIYLNFVIIVYLSRKCFDMKRMYWSRPKMEPASRNDCAT